MPLQKMGTKSMNSDGINHCTYYKSTIFTPTILRQILSPVGVVQIQPSSPNFEPSNLGSCHHPCCHHEGFHQMGSCRLSSGTFSTDDPLPSPLTRRNPYSTRKSLKRRISSLVAGSLWRWPLLFLLVLGALSEPVLSSECGACIGVPCQKVSF